MHPDTLTEQITAQQSVVDKLEREMHTAIKYHADAVRALNILLREYRRELVRQIMF